MRIHLITYATPRFRLRQILLGWSARLNRVVDTVTAWTPDQLLEAGFEERCPDIKLSERGSGFWAWKPFIIAAKLREVPEGDLVFYCDVGRLYPFKLLDQPVTPYAQWMTAQKQDMMPGILIPWEGPNSAWTKREAWVATGTDRPEVHAAAPIQASFSIWKVGPESRRLADKWLDLCARRSLISDDPSSKGLEELPGFRGHRHDQALLSLCCQQEGVHGLHLSAERPAIDSRHPSQVSRKIFGDLPRGSSPAGKLLKAILWPIEKIEQWTRGKVKFSQPIHE